MPHAPSGTAVDVTDSLASELELIDAMMSRTLDALNAPSNLDGAYRYALFSGGKRVRPMLALLSCEAVGGAMGLAHASAAAVEMIHAFSLVHDDLPALDNDELRRGKPTLHKAHGEAMAILAGDGLLTHAFSVICRETKDPALVGLLCTELCRGTGAMIDGQVYDTLGGFRGALSDEEKLLAIHHNKTGALITASCRMGALAGMWPEIDGSKLDAITAYGRAMGLMFQAVDDLLDVESTPDTLGKATQKDAEAGKLTYPGVFGVEGTRARIRGLQDDATHAIRVFGAQSEALAALCRTMTDRAS